MVKTYDLQNTSMGYEAYMEMVESLDIHGKPDGQGDWVRTVNYDAIAAARQHEFAYIEKVLKACSKATASDIRDELRDLRAWAANRSTCFSVETACECGTLAARGQIGDSEIYCPKCGKVFRASTETGVAK